RPEGPRARPRRPARSAGRPAPAPILGAAICGGGRPLPRHQLRAASVARTGASRARHPRCAGLSPPTCARAPVPRPRPGGSGAGGGGTSGASAADAGENAVPPLGHLTFWPAPGAAASRRDVSHVGQRSRIAITARRERDVRGPLELLILPAIFWIEEPFSG